MAMRFLASVALVETLLVMAVAAQGDTQSGRLASVPGGQTAAAALASSADGLSRYFAPDGPIQPGITAAMGLPMRAGELLNNGITRFSSGLNSGAQSLSRSAGQNGQIRMPGMDTLESRMPASIASLGNSMHSMIRSKNNFIRGQAEAGIQSANRLGGMMRQGLQGAMSVRSSGPSMGGQAAQMMSSAQDFMAKSGSQLKSQVQQHLDGTMSRLGSVHGMGEGVREQAKGLTRTLSNGLQGAMSQLQQTGEQVQSQLQQNHSKNMGSMSNILGSLQGSMGNMGGNMQKNIEGLARHAQSSAQQLSSSLQQAAQKPMEIISQLSSNLGSMMKGGISSTGTMSSGGRGY